jgi:hypothetical protein
MKMNSGVMVTELMATTSAATTIELEVEAQKGLNIKMIEKFRSTSQIKTRKRGLSRTPIHVPTIEEHSQSQTHRPSRHDSDRFG